MVSKATTIDLTVFRTQNTEFRTFYDVIHENEFHGCMQRLPCYVNKREKAESPGL